MGIIHSNFKSGCLRGRKKENKGGRTLNLAETFFFSSTKGEYLKHMMGHVNMFNINI